MDTQFFLELERPLESEAVTIPSTSGAAMRDRASTEEWTDQDTQQTRPVRGHVNMHGPETKDGKEKAAALPHGPSQGAEEERGKYTRYKMKYMRSLNFNDDEPRREARRQRSVSLPVSTSPKGRSLPSSGPLAVPQGAQGGAHAAHTPLPFVGESLPTAESVLVGGSFVPPHELVKHDSFSVWQYQQKKLVAKHAV